MSKYISEQTADGRELVDRLLELARGDGAVREKSAAILALLDRLAGRPMQPSEVALAVDRADRATPDEFDLWSGPERLAWLDLERARRAKERS